VTSPTTGRSLRRSVAMRVAMLFVACALLPLGGLAWLTLDRTTRELDAQARTRRHREAKAAAMAGLERLDVLERRLRGVAVLGDAVSPANIQELFGDHALDIGVLGDDGRLRAVHGAPAPPALDEQRARHLAQAGSLIVRASRTDAPAEHWMWVAANGPRIKAAVARVDQRAVWHLDDADPRSPMCVLEPRAIIGCTPDVPATLGRDALALPGNADAVLKDVAGDAVLARTWTIPLRHGYLTGPWIVVVFQSQAEARAPLATFVYDFWMVLLFSMLVVTLLSIGRVRRNLQPLDHLVAATNRLAHRQFDTEVTITTGDEFQVLGDAVNHLARELKTQFEQLEAFNFGTLEALARAIDAKSPWTAGHSERVAGLAVLIGREMGLSSERLDDLRRGGLVHDIGKLATPSSVLNQRNPLTAEERRVIEGHPMQGVRILQPIQAYAPLLPLVGQHHERRDGSGYPCGLRGEQIDPLARILAVADTFDAIRSDRPYRAGASLADTVAIIRSLGAQHFDSDVLRAFESLVASEALETGRTVGRLSSEHVAEMEESSNAPSSGCPGFDQGRRSRLSGEDV
jgi:putative nucleotidyltransferase with HDIG domain